MLIPNTNYWGDLAVAICISHFKAEGYEVLMPMGGHQRYDLVIEKEGNFKKVQCKWRSKQNKKSGYIVVTLGTIGSSKIKNPYLSSDFDLLWVSTPNGHFLREFKDLLHGKKSLNQIAITPSWEKFRVNPPMLHKDEPIKYRIARLDEGSKEKAIKMLKEGIKYPDQIALELKVSISTITLLATRNGISYKKKYNRILPEQKEYLIKRKIVGDSDDSIAGFLGVSRSCVSGKVRELKAQGILPKENQKAKLLE